MSRRSVAAFIAFNAKACEEAKRPVCRCPCGGAFHGAAHSAEWQREKVDELCGPESQPLALQLPLSLEPSEATQ